MTPKKHRRTFTGPNLLQIAMPMGGIGAGCICLAGNGAMQDFSIQNRPDLTALPDAHGSTPAAFALLHIKGRKPITRLMEGPIPPEKVYNQGLGGQGYRKGRHEGLPRFQRCRFTSEYPFGHVELADRAVPLAVKLTGYNPFIPLDDINSGIPCAILEYTIENRSTKAVSFEFSYHLSHLAVGSGGYKGSRNRPIPGGVLFSNTESPNHETFGSASLSVVGHKPRIKASWFRGGWFDWMGVLWRECSSGAFAENAGHGDMDVDGRNGGSILMAATLKPGGSITYPIIITWHFPNVHYVAPKPKTPLPAAPCGPECDCPRDPAPAWRPFYVSQWADAAAVAAHVQTNHTSLRARTRAFADALFSSTIPPAAIDAISANLAILKSPTVLRQEDGSVWGWEGCFAQSGCCPGTCTHVWNYAQAMPHLFPKLERTLREQELARSMDDNGFVRFRASLPDGGPRFTGDHAAADGQLGGIMKLYRDWQISGDREFLAGLYPLAQRSLDYCIAQWDPDRRGALFEPHHNTYDIEFWGPDGMCSSIYIGALTAMMELAGEMGDGEYAAACRELAARGAAFLDRELFNGEYFEQKLMWKELRDQSFVARMAAPEAAGNPTLQIEKAEGPKYQYGRGCLADGVIGAWMARIYGIDTPQTRANVRKNLKAIIRHNFKKDLTGHACLQRPGYAIAGEAGLILCTWPHGGQLTLPFPYSDEVWTGIEYQVASHCIEEGLVDEGLAIIAAARSRYEGRVRNPFNEYECGNYYARAMSSYAVLNSLSGFRYSAVTKTLHYAPKLAKRPFRSFFSTEDAFGTITLTRRELVIKVIEGKLAVERVVVEGVEREWKGLVTPGELVSLRSFD